MAQERQFQIKEAEQLFYKSQNEITKVLIGKGYKFTDRLDEEYEFRKSTSSDEYKAEIGLNKQHKLESFLWSEHLLNARQIGSEVNQSHYKRDKNTLYGSDLIIDSLKGLRILITAHPEINTITLVMEVIPGIRLQSNVENIKSSSQFFIGTKKFSDEDQLWYYKVTIEESKIRLQLFAGEKNTYYKNKTIPNETINGIIKDGKIITKDPPEYKTNRFKFENGVLYEVNNEGGYNEYKECN
jgi:hypothetical protein